MTHILVLGAGSVGKRHLDNLRGLGCRVSAMDPRADRVAEAGDLAARYGSIEQAARDFNNFDGVVVASPPKYHVVQSRRCLEAGLPVLLEKPVCASLAEAAELAAECKQNAAPLLLGYTYRWWPPLREFRDRLAQFGEPLHAKFVMSAHLADWHPWEPYQDFFMASRDLGGGALLDESHFVDLMLWFFGMPKEVYARVEKLSSLEIETDDNVDIIASYDRGLRVYIHLDLYGRPHEKYISVTGEGRTLEWSFDPNRFRYSDAMAADWTENRFDHERNDMFVEVAREFLQLIVGNTAPSCDMTDGINAMHVLEACRESARRGCAVSLDDEALRC